MTAKKRPPARKAPGKNIEDWQRGTERMTLRLDPSTMAALRARARAEDSTISAYVARLIRGDDKAVV